MSVLELKQEITRLDKRQREEIHAFLVRLKHNTPEWKRVTARRIRSMQEGKGFSPEQLREKLAAE